MIGRRCFLGAASLGLMHTPRPGEEYVGGWFAIERSWAGGLAPNHHGSNILRYSSIWVAAARDLALLVATNAAGKPAEDACEGAIKGLLQHATRDDRNRRR